MAELIKSDAIILHSIRWQESSKIVTVYSREWGKIGLIARGALRPKSPFAGNLESLNYVQTIVATKPTRNLQILTGIDVLESFNALRLNLKQLPYALALIELLDQVLEEHEQDAVFFDFIITMIQSLEKSTQPEIIFWYFLLKFSSYLGFRPQLQKCHICNTTTANGYVKFNLPQGAVFCDDCSANSSGGVKLTCANWYFLKELQKHPHKKIHGFSVEHKSYFNYTSVLIDYLNLHLEKNISVRSLQLLV